MNDIRDLLPGGKMRERTFQLKARRDVGVAWTEHVKDYYDKNGIEYDKEKFAPDDCPTCGE